MGRRIPQMPGHKHPRRKYPWDQWADGQAWEITRGTDFPHPAEQMRNQVAMWARRHQRSYITAVDGDTLFFRIFLDGAVAGAGGGV